MKADRILIPFAALSFAGTCVAFFFLPATIPIHWDAAGRIDGWGDRANILWMGAAPLALAILLRYLPRIDPCRESYARHEKTYEALKFFLIPAFAALGWITIAAALGSPLDTGILIRAVMGILFVGTGNYMGRLKRNYFVGIKTPWALADDEVWRLTQRRGGLVFVILGLVFILSLALPWGAFAENLVLVATFGGAGYVVLYSYLVWKRQRRNAEH